MKQNKFLYNIIINILRPFIRCLYPYEVIGTENLKNIAGGYILCSNHLSNVDPIFLAITHPRSIFFMAKAELFKFKVIGWILNKFGVFAVKRGSNDKNSINTAETILLSDEVLGIFIEGTRSKTGDFLRPKSGVSVISYHTKKPILPVCITGSGYNNKVQIFKKTKICYGNLIETPKTEIEEKSISVFRKFAKYIMQKIMNLR